MHILTAIITIDRDVDLAPLLYNALLENNVSDILIVTRITDKKTIRFWHSRAIVYTIPHYEIIGRHNMHKLAYKRRLAMRYAKSNNYDAIWFVDSDIIPLPETLNKLSSTTADICVAPAPTKWSNTACVGIFAKTIKLHEINWIDKLFERRPCVIAGLACTFIKHKAFNIPIEHKLLNDGITIVEGEDIGYFINCANAGIQVEYLPRMIQPHLF